MPEGEEARVSILRDAVSPEAVSTLRHPLCCLCHSCSSCGLRRESKGADGGFNPCWDSLDPDSAGAAGEWPQHAAGSPAAGELHPEGCPQPGHQPDGEQVRQGWRGRSWGCPQPNPGGWLSMRFGHPLSSRGLCRHPN